jgi:hypothetical protein
LVEKKVMMKVEKMAVRKEHKYATSSVWKLVYWMAENWVEKEVEKLDTATDG